MFTTVDEIKRNTGITVTQTTLNLAQMMIEAWVGRDEAEVEDSTDLAILEKAATFQAVYINGNAADILEQAGVKQIVSGTESTTFDTDRFAPYMAPFAIRACNKLSWAGSRSIHTGAMLQRRRGSFTDWWVRN